MEKITLIVTVYNRLEYIRNMLLCLIQQTKQIDELILADDGSKDDVKLVIEDLIEKCNFKIKIVYQEDIGFRLARSRNNGAREAIGEFLIFLDQDVIFSNDFIEKIYHARKKKKIICTKAIFSLEAQKNKVQKNIIESNNICYTEIYKNTIEEYQKKSLEKIIIKDILYKYLYKLKLRSRGIKILGLIFALYKEDYININGFDEKFKGWGEEDDDFGNRFFKYGGEVEVVRFKEYPIHMFHKSAPSKLESLNLEYYKKRKKEISKKNYKCEYGYYNTLDKDEVKIKIIK